MGSRSDPPVYAVETLRAPGLYSPAQIELALRIAHWLDRGKLVLAQEPER